ncbi:TPM domain-containing protein [Flavobacteriaceae bacterium AU392]|nr:TPM domain-containing protein [Flavobacteriaceae bacterium]RKM81429.1 TPM domain-containing protein [Flavobacteriaceae bacterium AU392]
MPTTVEDFLTASEEQEVIEAIRLAEKNTSGEIRVHIEKTSNNTLNKRALEVFSILKMHNTKLRNGVLIYVAVEEKAFVIYGDKGINDVVSSDFWNTTKKSIEDHFKNKNFKQGLVTGIETAGIQLKKYFPVTGINEDELPNEISFN